MFLFDLHNLLRVGCAYASTPSSLEIWAFKAFDWPLKLMQQKNIRRKSIFGFNLKN